MMTAYKSLIYNRKGLLHLKISIREGVLNCNQLL